MSEKGEDAPRREHGEGRRRRSPELRTDRRTGAFIAASVEGKAGGVSRRRTGQAEQRHGLWAVGAPSGLEPDPGGAGQVDNGSERESNRGGAWFVFEKWVLGDFPGGPAVSTWCSHCRGPGFDPWLGN